jgi:hypothetical protein
MRRDDEVYVPALDQLDPRRFDVLALADTATAYASLPDDVQEEYEDAAEYAGLVEAQHPLSDILRETRSEKYVVRDLDGALYLAWEDDRQTGRWEVGPLYRQHLLPDDELDDVLKWAAERGAHRGFDRPVLSLVLGGLPDAPGPVHSY